MESIAVSDETMSDDSQAFRRCAQTLAAPAIAGSGARRRRSRHGMTGPWGASICRVRPAAETGPTMRHGTARVGPDRILRRFDGRAGTTHSDNRVQISTLSRNFQDRLAYVRAPHWALPDPAPRMPVLGGCRRLVPEARSRATSPIGTARAHLGPGPAGEPCAARNRGCRAARPTLRRRLSC